MWRCRRRNASWCRKGAERAAFSPQRQRLRRSRAGRSGRITTFHVPFGYLHAVRDINDRDRLTPDGAIPPYTVHGFLLDNGRYQTLDAPGSLLTQAYGINERGQIVGVYYDATGRPHGFVHDKGRSPRWTRPASRTQSRRAATTTATSSSRSPGSVSYR
jgi:probable HAF family extracellular repeat protein